MTNMTIQQFCDLHSACAEGRGWALANCQTMADVWAKAQPDWLIWVATRRGVLTDRELRLFAVWSARQVQHLMTDPRSLAALDVAQRHANAEAADEELEAAWAAGAAGAAEAAAWAAARSAAWSADWSAAWSADRAADRSAAWSADRAAARSAQSDWIRANTSPNFEAKEEGR